MERDRNAMLRMSLDGRPSESNSSSSSSTIITGNTGASISSSGISSSALSSHSITSEKMKSLLLFNRSKHQTSAEFSGILRSLLELGPALEAAATSGIESSPALYGPPPEHAEGGTSAHLFEIIKAVYATVTASSGSLRRLRRLPREAYELVFSVLSGPGPEPLRTRLLCSALLRHMSPSSMLTQAALRHLESGSHRHLGLVLPVLLAQEGAHLPLESYIPVLVRWAAGKSCPEDVRLPAMSALSSVSRHYECYFDDETTSIVTPALVCGLAGASVAGARGTPQMVELDGSPCRAGDRYTVLCLGQQVPDNEFLSAFSFSQRHSLGGGSPPPAREVLESVQEYCLRVMEQATRPIPEDHQLRNEDRHVAFSAVLEAIRVLDTLCCIDRSMISRTINFPAFKRLLQRGGQSSAIRGHVLLAIVGFLLNHGDNVMYDSTPVLANFFRDTLTKQFGDQVLALETIMFCLDNANRLADSAKNGALPVLAKYMPNLLKILAWNPRTFLGEFLDLIPALITRDTCIGVFHSILDLPCLSAALEHQACGKDENCTGISTALYSYITRSESDMNGTISKLDSLHDLLQDAKGSMRVSLSAQITPALLDAYFDTMISDADDASILSLVPAMMERVSQLYAISSYQAKVRDVLAEQLVNIFHRYPGLVCDLDDSLLDYVHNPKVHYAMDGQEQFLTHVVWVIGEYTSPNLDTRCNPLLIGKYYGVLETLAYELDSMTSAAGRKEGGNVFGSDGHNEAVLSGRFMAVLLTAMVKLVTNYQDLLPRAQFCLTKVIKTQSQAQASSGSKVLGALAFGGGKSVIDRANHLLRCLRDPSIAATVIGAGKGRTEESENDHRNWNSALGIFLAAKQLA
eukprot:UC4_evm2s476